jgi:hypothetical protein
LNASKAGSGTEHKAVIKPKRAGDTWEAVQFFFVPRPGNLVTPVITIINVIVFVAMAATLHRVFSFSARDLVALGAHYGPLAKHGQWFRLITCVFVHGSVVLSAHSGWLDNLLIHVINDLCTLYDARCGMVEC